METNELEPNGCSPHSWLRVEKVVGDFSHIGGVELPWAANLKRLESDRTKREVVFHVPKWCGKVEWLSAGAQGGLARSVDTRTGKEIAIKMLSCTAQPRHVLREIRSMGLWQKHTNLACADHVYHAWGNGVLWVFIVMPLMKGSLDHWLDDFKAWRNRSGMKQASLPPDAVCMISYQILRGLLYLHAGGAVHRDLATRNILYLPVPPGEEVILEEHVTRSRLPPAVDRLWQDFSPAAVQTALASHPEVERVLRPVLERHGVLAGAEDGIPPPQLYRDVHAAFLGSFDPAAVNPPCRPDLTVQPGYDGPPMLLRISVSDFGLSRAGTGDSDAASSAASDGGYSTASSRSQMTDYVVSRYYRAPELILGHGLGEYSGEKVDVWSLGCIVGEMVTPSLSPFLTGKSSKEQIDYIFLLLGVPDPEEVREFATQSATHYVQRAKERERQRGKAIGTDFAKFFKAATPDCIEALRSMLVLNPAARPSASDLLQLPFFRRGAALCGSRVEPLPDTRLNPAVEEQIKPPGPDDPQESLLQMRSRVQLTHQLVIYEIHRHEKRNASVLHFHSLPPGARRLFRLFVLAVARTMQHHLTPFCLEDVLPFVGDHHFVT